MRRVRRFPGLSLCGFASLIAACSGDPASPPVSPTESAPSTPAVPTPQPSRPAPAAGQFAVAGVVQQAGRPIPRIYVNAWVEQANGFGYSWWWAHGPLYADSAGHFVISGLPAGARVWLQSFDTTHDQQCAVSIPAVQADTTLDISTVAPGAGAAAPQSIAGSRSVSGTVVTSSGQPAAGAWIDFEPIPDFSAAAIHADSAGRFALCGLPVDETVSLGASLGSSGGSASVPPGQSDDVRIVLQ